MQEPLEQKREKWLCRWSPTLGALEETASNIWGTWDYEASYFSKSFPVPCVFFGIYGLPDFYTLWRHKGRKCILWAGTDILHFLNGYWLDVLGHIKLDPLALAQWINSNCESYVENDVEAAALRRIGIEPMIVPSFLGRVEAFEVAFKPSSKVRLYTSVSGENYRQYGWDKIIELAAHNPFVEFHLYGNTKPFDYPADLVNIFDHGRVNKEVMNAEIKEMTGALRLTEFDGFSEIIAKSLLLGQWPVSIIQYPHTLLPENINVLQAASGPNLKGREWFLSVVNKYPWNIKS